MNKRQAKRITWDFGNMDQAPIIMIQRSVKEQRSKRDLKEFRGSEMYRYSMWFGNTRLKTIIRYLKGVKRHDG